MPTGVAGARPVVGGTGSGPGLEGRRVKRRVSPARGRGPGPAQQGSSSACAQCPSARRAAAAECGQAGALCPGVPGREAILRAAWAKGACMIPHFPSVNKNVTFQAAPWLGLINLEPLFFLLCCIVLGFFPSKGANATRPVAQRNPERERKIK